MQWIGGTQSPHLRGFLRAAYLRQQVAEPIRYDVHDVDAAGRRAVQPGVVIRPSARYEGWFPVLFERTPAIEMKYRVVVGHPEPLTLAGLSLGFSGFGQQLLDELASAMEAASLVAGPDANSRRHVQERGEKLIEEMRRFASANPQAAWSGWVIHLARTILGHRLDGIELGTTSEYWSLGAPAERFSVLDRFLADRSAMEVYAQARGLSQSWPLPRDLPFMVILRRLGLVIREALVQRADGVSLRLGGEEIDLGPCDSAEQLFVALRSLGATDVEPLAVFPKAVPLIAQLREIAQDFAGKIDYLFQVRRLADGLDLPQLPVYRVRFDLASALPRSAWRHCLRQMRERYWRTRSPRRNGRELEELRTQPNLIWLWLAGGDEWVDGLLRTGRLSRLDPERRPDRVT